jgi:hypothetical protein
VKHVEKYFERVERERVLKVTCDWCGREIERPGSHDYRELVIRALRGESYPEMTDAKGWGVDDLCDECVDKLKDLLAQNGIRLSDQSFET